MKFAGRKYRHSLLLLLLSVCCLSCSPPEDAGQVLESEQRDELVINGGRVLDPETQLDAIRSLRILRGRIAEVSETPLSGEVVIDATGLVVSPGFIDLHSHGQSTESDVYKVHDGVTTALDLELGRPNLENWLDERSEGAIVNFGAAASHQYARTRAGSGVFGRTGVAEPLETSEIAEMREVLEGELAAGGIGIGIGIAYVPGVSSEELRDAARTAGDHGVPFFVHVRNPDLASIEEAIDLAQATESSVHIMHINSMALSEIETALALIAEARQSGVDVSTEVYPYTAGSTFIETPIFDQGWQERFGVTYSDLQWQDTGERLTEETFQEYRLQGGAVIIHMMQEEWIERALAEDQMIIASDGMPYAPGAHPRSAGTFARILGRYVRERGVLSLPEAIRRMTLLPAQRIEHAVPGARRKGRIQLGMDADITVFDPATVIDRATFEDGLAFSSGIEFVIVNGTVVVNRGESVVGVHPGQPLLGVLTE